MLSMSDADNSTKAARVVGRPFAPGRSGNPGGRPKAALDVQALAREHTTAAIRALSEALRDPKLKVAAAQALLDRGWGKPTVQINAQSEATVLHLIAAQAIGDQLVAEIGEARPTASAEPLTFEALSALPLPLE
jgi:hypothetical protein